MAITKNLSGRAGPGIGAMIILILLTPFLRTKMESDMVLHMLIQIPLIVFSGWLLAKAISEQTRARLEKWNHAGVTGLLMTSLILMFWMLPRPLDMVLTNNTLEFLKFISLALAGAALAQSWTTASMIVRGFFLGNVLPMMMVVGWLYVVSPIRICNSYLTNDQVRTGNGLIALAIAGSLVWLYAFFIPNEHEGNEASPKER